MVGLVKEYQDVLETSKDVVRLKQRHLIKEVLERLNFITVSEDTTITFLTNEQVRFFFIDILSLVVDNDSAIQCGAINAIEKILSKIEPSAYQTSSEWPIIRDRIVEEYTQHISKVRDSSNNVNWYKIWCLLIQVLDQDIIRSVLIINKYLAIVEQSFKSPNLEVRAQAFICWKALVKMFFKYNELIPTKRVKLVNIPFRSSQAKTLYAAETKFEAYWYFLVKLSESHTINADSNYNNSLELHQELVFAPFLQFCFGNSINGYSTLKQYPKMKEITIYVLIAMLNPNNKEIEVQLEYNNLEKPKEAVISEMIMQTNWKAIIRSCFEASLIIVGQGKARKKLFDLLWHGLVHHVIQSRNPEIYKECCSVIQQLIDTDKENPELLMKSNILDMVQVFGTHYNYLYDINNNTANYVQIFEIVTCITDILLLNEENYFSEIIFEPITKNVYNLEKYKNLTKFWELKKDLIEYILTTDQLNDFTNFAIKISIWKAFSVVLCDYMNSKLFEFRLQSKFEVVNKWVVWPLKKCGWIQETKQKAVEKIIDNSFFVLWKKVMLCSANAQGRSNFIKQIIPSMRMLSERKDTIPHFDDVFSCYIECMDKNFEKNSKPTETLDLLKTVLSKTPPKNCSYNKIIENFLGYISDLKDIQIILIFEELKSITTTLGQADKLRYITKNCFELYKKTVIELLKRESLDKKYLKEFRSALKSDEFVIIPSVWALNPERLTEHQKEKMKEKKDNIPALYNDMNSDSHSQDSSSIKPWTPNKIVIPRGKDQLIISSPKTTASDTQSKEMKNPPEEKGNQYLNQNLTEKSPFKKPKEKTNSISSPVKSPLKKLREEKISPLKANKSVNSNSSESDNVEKMVKDSDEKEKKISPKQNSNRSKSVDPKKYKITKEDEALLKSMNVDVQDEKKRYLILCNIKSLRIDTVEGKKLLKSQFAKERTRKSANPKKNEGGITSRKINDKKKAEKRNVRNRKSLIDKNTEDNLSPKNKLNENETLTEEKNEKIKSHENNKSKGDFNLNTILAQKNSKVEILQNSSVSVSSEDEFIEPSQRSESILARRPRKSSINMTTTCQSPLKNNLGNVETLNKHDKNLNEDVFANTTAEGKANVLRNIDYNDNKNISIENKKISEMDTELNTEFLQSEKIVPITRKEEQSSRLLKNTSSEESQERELSRKSPRKRLVYETVIENTSKDKVVRSINNSADMDGNNTDSIIFPSLTQSPAVDKTSRSGLVEKLIAAAEASPKMQKLLNEVCNGENSKNIVTRSSPRKSPQLSKIITGIETQPNTECDLNAEMTKTETQIRSRNPRKLPGWAKKNPSEVDTEPNAELLNSSVQEKGNTPQSPSTPKRDSDIYKYNEDRLIESPAYSPIKPFNNSLKKVLNQSIIASPECGDFEEKNAEFMNNTLNISPIPIDNDKIETNSKVADSHADRLFDDLKSLNEHAKIGSDIIKQTSPIKKSTKPASLNSPPDRKNTNNSASPALKSKNQSGLTGRGAQLINMIRNRKIDTSTRFSSSPFRTPKSEEGSILQEQNSHHNSLPTPPSPPKKSFENNNGTTAPPTPQAAHDLLTFSKTLPSPYASPSASILKRKFRKESLEDYDSPAYKRKRVSFHDPPVSVTKEYVKHSEEDKPTQMRPNKMHQERTSTPTNNSMKHSLKRKNRIDSMLELARFNDSPQQLSNVRMIEIPRKSIENEIDTIEVANSINNIEKLSSKDQLLPSSSALTSELQECDSSKQMVTDETINNVPATSVQMDSLKFNATADSTTNIQQNRDRIVIDEDDDEPRMITPSPSIYFTDENAVLKYVVEKYAFDEIYEKYREGRENNKDFLTNKLVRTVFKDLSVVMEKDVRIKTNVLEMLSEKHPKEFLDHAIQENLSSVVCERLNTNSVIDYICETFKNNIDSRKMILDKISNILTTERFNLERHEYFIKLLHYEKMSSEEIIDCIEIITKNRR
ncbi:telomere-associated protein RIF1 [Condylostylus longicornis]|uniref:telomere-associated protein RIF1 n=1 Tax=Condylostylus longicornis TaxID=2530218 RepID=UPI00244E0174|nr:telomere-associated protein RIF1 [Condylostylus longicornis]